MSVVIRKVIILLLLFTSMTKFNTEKKEWNIAVFFRIAQENGMSIEEAVEFIQSNITDATPEEIGAAIGGNRISITTQY